MSPTATASHLQADEVARYLREQPGFLGGYPELATQLVLPREHGAASSLAAYQLHGLREKNQELERRLAELVTIAAENEKLMQRVHALTLTLLGTASLAGTVSGVLARLGEDFHAEHLRLVLFGPYDVSPIAGLVSVAGPAALPEFEQLGEQHEPLTGRLSSARLTRLFGEQASEVQSAAVVPLGEMGLLAIGSEDADRFQPGVGTLFLKMIAASITAALKRAGAPG